MEKSKIRKLIWRAKRLLQKEPAFLESCKKHGQDPDFIEDIKVSFQPLDVSAKTVNGEIILNEKLLEEDMREIVKYLLHEAVHCEQQEGGQVNEKTNNCAYLDDPNEVEAFRTQLKLMEKYYTDEEIQTYIENLLSHHSITGKERKDKAKELTKKI